MAKTKYKRGSGRTEKNKDSYGDLHYSGNGTLLCHFCSLPVRDHPIAEPCPFPHDPLPDKT